MKIAVFVDAEGRTLPFHQSGVVRLYDSPGGPWRCLRELPFEAGEGLRLAETRARMQAVVGQLEDCRVFIARTVKGVPYSILEGLGFAIWKLDGRPEGFLDYVRGEEERLRAEKLKPKPGPLPVGDVRDGNYRIDLVKVLASDSSLSSKQVLLPFLQKTAFQKLEVLCEHAPRWFDKEFAGLKLRQESREAGEGLCLVTVLPVA
jgi:Fe-only nitrogenase accessory protein AnfO